MRIFGIFLFGLSTLILTVITVLFFSFYNSFNRTEFLFDQYKSSGVYSSISSAVKDQISNSQEPSYEQTQEEALQSQIQEQFISSLFSEQSVENLIEKNLTRLNEFINSDQKTFTAYTPFSDASSMDSVLSQMGMGELTQDPEFGKMFEQSSQNMMAQNNPFQALTPLAENLKSTLTIFKYLLPILTLISLGLFILLGRGIGRIRNIGILTIIISINLGISFFLWRVIYVMGIQSGGWGDQNIGSQIASGIVSPIILLSTDWIGKCAIFSFIIGLVCITVWFVLRMNRAHPAKKASARKKRT